MNVTLTLQLQYFYILGIADISAKQMDFVAMGLCLCFMNLSCFSNMVFLIRVNHKEGWNREIPQKKTPDHPQAELGLSHMWPWTWASGEMTSDLECKRLVSLTTCHTTRPPKTVIERYLFNTVQKTIRFLLSAGDPYDEQFNIIKAYKLPLHKRSASWGRFCMCVLTTSSWVVLTLIHQTLEKLEDLRCRDLGT